MNPYEGLNLPQLIELMHELVVPEPVSWIPATTGWLVIGGWLLAVAGIALREFILHRRRNRYRRDAAAMLRELAARTEADPEGVTQGICTVLKRTALQAYPRETVASLSGPDWAQFLCETSNDDPVVVAAATQLATAAYRRDPDPGELLAPAQRWIRVHRA